MKLCLLVALGSAAAFSTAPRIRRRSSLFAGFDDISSPIASIDPVIHRILVNDTETTCIGSVLEASAGISVWRNVLLKGRLPIESDFPEEPWPNEPLFSALSDTMAQLQLPRFVVRHPATVQAVLLCLCRMVMEFASRREQILVEDDEQEDESIDDDDDERSFEMMLEMDTDTSFEPLSEEETRLLAEEIAGDILDEFGGVVSGVQLLDQIFGYNHQLLDQEGYGLQDGVWQHSGWQVIPELQRQVSSMPELRDMMKELGRRPTAIGDSVYRFAPRQPNQDGTLGAQLDPATRTSIRGLTLSSSLAEMLPSEAVLLKGSPALRRLFLAKKAESKLLSYELSGFTDIPSVPQTRPWHLPRMPSAPGGPIIVCLDTSWSMSGRREWLSKAVVLACVSAAHKQKRTCRVVAFSKGCMDAGEISADATGIQRLLDFLSHSFGGGTDVTGALKHAMTTMSSDEMAGADLLLVTDGEIPDPPVSEKVMDDLDRLKRRTGMQIHGLLVGKRESQPLSRLCTQTHDFLIGYEMQGLEAPQPSTASALSATRPIRGPTQASTGSWGQRSGFAGGRGYSCSNNRLSRLALFARRYDDDFRTAKRGNKRRRRFEDDDDEYYENASWEDEREYGDGRHEEALLQTDEFNSLVDKAAESVKAVAIAAIHENAWQSSSLDKEKHSEGSCWRYRDELRAAIGRVNENLVEREEEARLVVLGMAASEHVLFLGPPGTAKSALGRRLSKLCGGFFFQRLLTRFTTPEEIFGPLSLRALENDEYRRCTEGFLPRASVAFLDEIFKANSAILNTLLTILNERQFDNGGGVREDCPIRCVIAASNELPESDELDALYDRFLLRKEVLPVSDDGIVKILNLPTPGSSLCDDPAAADGNSSDCDVVFSEGLDRVVEALSAAANAVQMGSDASCLLRDLRNYMRDELDVDISDRRLVKAARLLKVSAASHGRSIVDPIDCLLLQHMAWRLPEQRSAMKEWLWDHLTPGSVTTEGSSPSTTASQVSLLLNGLRREALEVVRKTNGDVTGASGGRPGDIAAIESLRLEAARLADLLQQQANNLSRHIELLRRSMDHLWLDPDEARSAQQLLIPKAEKALSEATRVLVNARSLALALSDGDTEPSLTNDVRLSVIESLWDDDDTGVELSFSDDALDMGMKEAKAKYDPETFRRWKRERKKANKK